MILRRIGEAVRRQDWLVVILEVLIVVFGVFIGLQVDDWNKERENREVTQTYYARLIDDLTAELEVRQIRITYYQRARAHGLAALEAHKGSRETLGQDYLIDLYQATQYWPYTPQRSTYDELLAGGIARAIPDPVLRTRLGNYYNNLENSRSIQTETTLYRENLRSFMPIAVQNLISKTCGDKFVFDENFLVNLELSEVCEVEIPPGLIIEALLSIENYFTLERDLNRQLADIETKLGTLKGHLGATRDLIAILEEKLE